MSSLFKVSDQLQQEMLGELCARNIPAHLEYRPEEGPKIDARVRFLHLARQQVLIDLPIVSGRPVMIRPGEPIRLFFLWKGQRFAVTSAVRERTRYKAGDSSLEALAIQYPKEIERAQRRECFRLSLLHLPSATLRLCRVTDPDHPERSRPAPEQTAGKKAAAVPASDTSEAQPPPTPSAPNAASPPDNQPVQNSIAVGQLKPTLATVARQLKPPNVTAPAEPSAGGARPTPAVPATTPETSPPAGNPTAPDKEQANTETAPATSPSDVATEAEAEAGPPPLDPNAPFGGRLLNLSETGCGAVFEKASTPSIDIGELFHVDFKLPRETELFYLIAQIRWVRMHPAGDRVMVGMAWQLDPSERKHREVQSRIGRFIASEQREVLRRARTE